MFQVPTGLYRQDQSGFLEARQARSVFVEADTRSFAVFESTRLAVLANMKPVDGFDRGVVRVTGRPFSVGKPTCNGRQL